MFENGAVVYFIRTKTDLRKGQDLLAKQQLGLLLTQVPALSVTQEELPLLLGGHFIIFMLAASDATRYRGKRAHCPSYGPYYILIV